MTRPAEDYRLALQQERHEAEQEADQAEIRREEWRQREREYALAKLAQAIPARGAK